MDVYAYSDECFRYLTEANSYIKKMVTIDEFDLIFREDAEEVQTNIANNKKNSDGAGNSLMNALAALKNMILGLIKRIIGGIEKLFASKGEKSKFAQVQEAIKNNPKLANKKVTFFDFKHNTAKMQEIEQEAARADSLLASGKDVAIDGIISKIREYSGAIRGVGTALTAEAALKACQSNRGMQQEIANKLNNDKDFMAQLERDIGKHQARKLRRQVNSYGDNKFFSLFGKRINLKREINRLRGKQCDSMMDACNQVFDDILKDAQRVGTAMDYTKANEELKAQGGIVNFFKRGANNVKAAATVVPVANNGVLKKITGNKEVRDIGQGFLTGRKEKKKAKVAANKQYNQAVRNAAYDDRDYQKRTAKGDYSAQSAGSFLTGADKKKAEREKENMRREALNNRVKGV